MNPHRCGAWGARKSASGSACCHCGAKAIMSEPLEPKPCSRRTICLGVPPERGLRLAPFTILDNEFSTPGSCMLYIRMPTRQPMNLDDLLQRYFGTLEHADASPAMREAGVDRLRV